MAIPMVAANWKMHTTVGEAEELVRSMLDDLATLVRAQIVLCPPAIALANLRELVHGTRIYLGAQNAHWEPRGPFTGEISPEMLQGLCEYVILGHSERRHLGMETDEVVGSKVGAVLRASLTPIICIGETLEERTRGDAETVIIRQLHTAMTHVLAAEQIVVAYEPVWAIGTGRAADGPSAGAMATIIRELLAKHYGAGSANEVQILYGGSVNSGNIAEYMIQPNINGALVGGASLVADEFLAITNTVANTGA